MEKKYRTKKKTIEDLEEELRELKKDYKEARREIKELEKSIQIISESREYWKEKILRRDAFQEEEVIKNE